MHLTSTILVAIVDFLKKLIKIVTHMTQFQNGILMIKSNFTITQGSLFIFSNTVGKMVLVLHTA